VVQDVLLYPLVGQAYDPDQPESVRPLVGAKGIAKERLAPSGYITEVNEMARIRIKMLIGALLVSLASTTLVFAAQHMQSEGANTIIGTISLVDAESGIIWLKDQNDTRLKMVAPPEEQLQGLEAGNRVEVRLEHQKGTEPAASQADQTVAGTIRKVDETAKLLRIETAKGNIIDISPLSEELSAGMEAGERVRLTIHKQ